MERYLRAQQEDVDQKQEGQEELKMTGNEELQ